MIGFLGLPQPKVPALAARQQCQLLVTYSGQHRAAICAITVMRETSPTAMETELRCNHDQMPEGGYGEYHARMA